MGWIITGVVLLVIVLSLYACFVVAGRADHSSEQYYNSHFKDK